MSDDEQNKTKKARKNSRVTREFGTVAHPGDSVVGVRSCRDSTSRLLLAGSCFGRTVTVHFPSQASLQRQSHHISPHKPVCNGSHIIFPITSQSATAVTVYFLSQASLQRQSQYISPHKPVYKGSHSIFPHTSQSATAVTVYFPSQASRQRQSQYIFPSQVSLQLSLCLCCCCSKTTTTKQQQQQQGWKLSNN